VKSRPEQDLLTGIFLSISAGVFVFIGLLLWRKTFLTPFDWTKKELVIVCVIFFLGSGIQALTRITEPVM
jgi:high-affinity Fe2+/Pb2+ permease